VSCRAGRLSGLYAHELQAVFAAFVFARQLRERSCVPADYAFARWIPYAQVPHEGRVARQVEKCERSREEVPDCVSQDETERLKLARLT
jgi:hypothetical protein